ncbi:MAG TPA: NAD(P)-binding domain-containing protein [Nannocystis sp.]|jgi:hypothetical protein
MKIAVLGTGTVGETLADKLVSLGHHVTMGSRTRDNTKAVTWTSRAGERAAQGSFADAVADAELVFLCTLGSAAVEALTAAGEDALAGKVIVDTTNPLDFSRGFPPRLFVVGDDSLGEQIQRAFPRSHVVKALNTIGAPVMVEPSRVPGEHVTFLAGNDADAKTRVRAVLTEGFGWQKVIDLGDITGARATEGYMLVWLRLWGALQTPMFNIQISTGA